MTLLLTHLFHCFQLPLYTASPRGTRPGSAAKPIRFCGARFKDKVAAVYGGREWVVMTPYFKNCAVCLCPFQNELLRRRTKNYVYNENSKQIRKSELTTFETIFVQNVKQIIV